jgi:predicted Zn-dependent protease
LALFYFIFCFCSNLSIAQDSIPEKVDVTEDASLQFQEFFFKALSQKSIGNHQRAIENLENCNQLIANNVAVFFEFSKNFLAINNLLLAKTYIEKALAKDEKNVWMLKHLVKIHQKERNFEKAIAIMQKVVEENPKEREFLVQLYLQNKQNEEAISLMNILDSENTLSSYLKKIRKKIEHKTTPPIEKKEGVVDLSSLINKFATNKSYKILKQILEKSKNNPSELLKYSTEGISLFPAQPYIYLVKAKTLNSQKNHKKALDTLQNGIDFVIDDEMEADFYKEIAKAYKGLGNAKEENKYQQKAKKLKS